MHAWEAIQNSVNYIEGHLQEEIDTIKLAGMVGLSPFYFQRLFARLVKKPVHEYIKLRRLAKAAKELEQSNRRILDIAIDYSFSNHANFTRAFKEVYGITPEDFRKTRPLLNTFIKPDLFMNYIIVDEGMPLIVDDIVLEIERKSLSNAEIYIGYTANVTIAEQIPVGESTGIDIPGQLWLRYHSEKEKIIKYLVPDVELGMSYSTNDSQGIFTYFAGGLVKIPPKQIEHNFCRQELPAGEYILCKIEAENFEKLVNIALNKAIKYMFDTWLPSHNLTTKPFSAEKYYKSNDICSYMEIWVAPLPA